MSIRIDYEAKHGIANLLRKARKFGKDNGVEVNGDDTSGTVSKGGILPVRGTYQINGESITIEITQIPVPVSWGTARSEVLKWLEKNDAR